MSHLRRLPIALLLVLALPAAASAGTVTVNPGDDAQAKVDSAANGDTVLFKAGTHQATITTAKTDLTLEGEAGASIVAPSGAAAGKAVVEFTAGPNIIKGLTLANTVTTGPVVKGGAGLTVLDSFLLSTTGNGVDLGGGTGLVQRSRVITTKSGAIAAAVTAATGDAAETLTIDSTVLVGPTALSAEYPAAVAAGAGITVSARHVSAIGAIVANAQPGVLVATGIAVTFLDSVIRGGRVAVAGSPAPAAITAGTDRNSVRDNASDAATLFVAPAKFNYHLRADAPNVIDVGQTTAGESDKDLDGEARVTGSASDYGADEFVNKAPTAELALAAPTNKVRQNIAATFDASKSTDPESASGGGVASYHWDFGDGSTADTTTPTTTHAFAERKAYLITVTVTDKQGAASAVSAPVAIEVIDGTQPTVTIAQPKVKQRIKLYKPKTKRRAKVTFFGSASDDTGLAKVYLALRPVGLTAGKCRWFDGKRALKTGECANPIVLETKLSGTSWRYRLPLGAKLKKGPYQLVAIAVDTTGLPSVLKAVSFRFR